MIDRLQNQRLSGACNRSPGSKLLSITTQLHCGGHLGGRAQLPDTILDEDPSNDYSIKVWFYLSYWFQTRWFLCEFPIGSYVKLSTAVQPFWSNGGTTRHNFGRGEDFFIISFPLFSNLHNRSKSAKVQSS